MKKIIVLALLLIISVTSFSQQPNPAKPDTRTDYLQKSKEWKVAGCILLGCSSIALYLGGRHKSFIDSHGPGIIAGTLIISIPVFIISHRNKKKAMLLSFKNEIVPKIENSSFVYRNLPSLTLNISL